MDNTVSKEAARLLARMVCGKVRSLKPADQAAFDELYAADFIKPIKGTFRPTEKARAFIISGESRRILTEGK